MSTSPAKIAANKSNARHSTGPRTDSGKSASAQNARKYGLFSAKDFIRPHEQSEYDDLDQSLRADLYPEGRLEHHLVDEIRRAMWRLRRCGEVEASMLETCAQLPGQQTIPDPIQNEPTAATQLAVDRARAQCHRLLHRCVAELRKLQTERHQRREYFGYKADVSDLGLADWRAINKGVAEKASTSLIRGKVETIIANNRHHEGALEEFRKIMAEQELSDPLPTEQTQIARNAPCPCGSGLKHKRCCGPDAAPILQTAA